MSYVNKSYVHNMSYISFMSIYLNNLKQNNFFHNM